MLGYQARSAPRGTRSRRRTGCWRSVDRGQPCDCGLEVNARDQQRRVLVDVAGGQVDERLGGIGHGELGQHLDDAIDADGAEDRLELAGEDLLEDRSGANEVRLASAQDAQQLGQSFAAVRAEQKALHVWVSSGGAQIRLSCFRVFGVPRVL